MKKVILIFVTIVLFGLLYAKDNKSTDALLHEIDGIIKNRQTYGAEKEARIADLKKLLTEATSDEQLQSPNQKIPDRKTKCVIKTHINIKQNVIFGAKLKPV